MDAQRAARAAYTQALKPPKGSSRNVLNQWLTTWKEAFQRAHDAQVPEVAYSNLWLEDLCQALEPRVPALKQQVLTNSLYSTYPARKWGRLCA
jgi:hypothetical protein